MTDDLQYRQYSDIPYLSLNNSIFSALLRVKDFESFEIMEYNVESKNPFVYLDLECSSFILHDPISGKNLKLI
jgi:hypothetical protein